MLKQVQHDGVGITLERLVADTERRGIVSKGAEPSAISSP
jgi:hypothetical protein